MRVTPEPNEDLEPYGDERGRIYKASGGSRKNSMLLFIPHPTYPRAANFDRLFPYIHVQFVEIRKDGSEVWIEFPYLTIVLKGRNLRSVGLAIGAHACSRVEAFDAAHRDQPAADQPFIETIDYMVEKKAAPEKLPVVN